MTKHLIDMALKAFYFYLQKNGYKIVIREQPDVEISINSYDNLVHNFTSEIKQ